MTRAGTSARLLRLATFSAVAAVLGLSAAPAAAAPYAKGERVRVSGVVTDAAGKPLAGLQVALEASRSFFDIRQLKTADKDVRRAVALTDAKGEYAIDWPWDNYYNSFALAVGIPVRKGGKDEMEVLEREDVTPRIQAGQPVIEALVVKNAAYIDKVRQFVASLKSADERKVYDEMGNPDEVRRTAYADHDEASWWYFESGRMYRFQSGKLEQVVRFDPVKPF
ncbi:MAG TPA: hypothetical protein VOA87_11030 [Thermoanaerobaculia bacterium]|nr:hypothetical protein [Thermoanaerobaculia bacterium]